MKCLHLATMVLWPVFMACSLYDQKVVEQESPDDFQSTEKKEDDASLEKPLIPQFFSATLTGNNHVRLAWQLPGKNSEQIEIEKTTTNPIPVSVVLLGGYTEYIDQDVQEGQTYHYRIRAGNSVGNSDYSASVKIVIPQHVPVIPSCRPLPIAKGHKLGLWSVRRSDLLKVYCDGFEMVRPPYPNATGLNPEERDDDFLTTHDYITEAATIGFKKIIYSLPINWYLETGLCQWGERQNRIACLNDEYMQWYERVTALKDMQAPDPPSSRQTIAAIQWACVWSKEPTGCIPPMQNALNWTNKQVSERLQLLDFRNQFPDTEVVPYVDEPDGLGVLTWYVCSSDSPPKVIAPIQEALVQAFIHAHSATTAIGTPLAIASVGLDLVCACNPLKQDCSAIDESMRLLWPNYALNRETDDILISLYADEPMVTEAVLKTAQTNYPKQTVQAIINFFDPTAIRAYPDILTLREDIRTNMRYAPQGETWFYSAGCFTCDPPDRAAAVNHQVGPTFLERYEILKQTLAILP